jgi:hypothetical protein
VNRVLKECEPTLIFTLSLYYNSFILLFFFEGLFISVHFSQNQEKKNCGDSSSLLSLLSFQLVLKTKLGRGEGRIGGQGGKMTQTMYAHGNK